MYKLVLVYNNFFNWDVYWYVRNKVVYMICSVKCVFYCNVIKSNFDNFKNFWRIICNISFVKCLNFFGYLSVNGYIVSDNIEIVN